MEWNRLKTVLIVVFTGILMSGRTQNLAPNPGFEVFTECPPSNGATPPGPMLCPPWVALSTANWFHACGDPLWFGVPYNIWGFQYAHMGAAYTGGYCKGATHEYIQAPLLDTLEAGVCYKVGFWLNLSNESCGMNRIGALLTPDPVMFPTGMNPQVNWGGEFFSDTVNWIFVWDFITAVGNELYITIGNFYPESQTAFDPACDYVPAFTYYYYDDVIIEAVPAEPFEVFLDATGSGCDSFVIEPTIVPELDCTLLEWSTGEHGPSITVYESGEYSVTVTYGCVEMEASIDITLNNPPPPDLGPDAILCEGETIAISLDPDAGQYEWQDGSTDADYSISTAGVYQVTLDDGCDIRSDTITVTYIDPPSPISLGPDTFLCPGEEITFQFDPALGDFLWQDSDDSPVYVIDDEGTYALTVSNDCGSVSDDIDVSITLPPAFDLGPDSAIICTGDIIDLELDASMGSFLWQDGSTLSYYQITSPGTYSLTVSNVCGTLTDAIHVIQVPEPDINFEQTLHACDGDTLVLSTGNNVGSFTWQDGSMEPTLEVTVAGTYSVSITNYCGEDDDEVEVIFHPHTTIPDLGPDRSLCPGDQVVLHVSSPAATYQWNDLSTADSLVVTTAGTYFVIVTGYCDTFSDTVQVSLNNQPPALTLPDDFGLCTGQSFTIDPAINEVNYVWQDGAVTPQYIVTSPGTYTLTVSNACGSDADTLIVTDAGLPPTVALSPDTAICTGTSFILIPGFSNVNAWLWSDGSTGSSYLINAPGEISVIVNNTCGTAVDTMVVGTLPPVPQLSLGTDTLICAGELVTLSIPFSDVSISWSNGSSESEIVVSGPASVFASIENVCGVSYDTLQISLLPDIPSLELGPDITICPGVEVLLTPEIPEVNYVWQDGSTNETYLVTQAGVISLLISNTCGEAQDTLIVSESFEGPQVDLGADVLGCEGDSIHVGANLVGVSYLWSDGSTDSDITVSQTGVWILAVSNLCGADRDTISIEISGVPPVPVLGQDSMICEGQSVTLISNADAITSTVWQDGSTAPTLVVTVAGQYILHHENRCGAASDTILIAVHQMPEPFYLGPDTTLCPGASFIITAPVTTDEIQWQDGSSGTSMIADRAQTYSLTIENECGLVVDELIVAFDNQVPVVDLDHTPLCPGDTILLNAMQSFDATYIWSTGSQLSAISVSSPGLYGVDVSTFCFELHSEVEIVPAEHCRYGIYIPNVFSPNGDGINDVWTVSVGSQVDVLKMQCTIFDRWGNMQFQSSENPVSWNGMRNDELFNPAVFVYTVEMTYRKGDVELTEKFTGDLTLIR